MSYQACNWAVAQQVVIDPPARHVLLCMANYASVNGEDVWMSAARIARETGLSIRTVRYKLDDLQAAGLISPGDERIVAIKFPRADKRPLIFNLNLKFYGVQELHAVADRGAVDDTNGLHLTTERGAGAAPNTIHTNHIDQPTPPNPRKRGNAMIANQQIGAEKYSESFEQAWALWPQGKRGTKTKAYAAWLKRKLDDASLLADESRVRIITDIVVRTAKHRPWLDGFGIPHFSTYLNGGGWTADIDNSTGPTTNGRAKTSYEQVMEASERNRAALREDYDNLSPDEQRDFRAAFGH